jgi:predicted acyltransferase
MRTAAALLSLVGATLAQQPLSCSVRIMNEVNGAEGGVISLANATGPNTFVSAHTYQLSEYTALPGDCASISLRVVDGKGAQFAPVIFAPTAATTLYTVVAMSTISGVPRVLVLADSDTQIDDSGEAGTIDVSLFKVCNSFEAGGGSVDLHLVSAECYNCSHPFFLSVPYGECTGANPASYRQLLTTWPTSLQIVATGPAGAIVTEPMIVTPLEHGIYTLFIHNLPAGAVSNTSTYALLTWGVDTEGRNAYLPILYAFLILAAGGVLHKLAGWLAVKVATTTDIGDSIAAEAAKRRGKKAVDVTLLSFFGFDRLIVKAVEAAKAAGGASGSGVGGKGADEALGGGSLNERLLAAVDGGSGGGGAAGTTPAAPVAAASTKPKSTGRIRSIDTFRGLSLAIMIFVNYGGGSYDGIFDHSRWNGLTVADLVFPWFVWTQGVSMAISFMGERKRGATPAQLARKTVIRAMKLYALGLFLNNGATLNQWRVIGVLQYFAASYLCVGLLESFLHPAAAEEAMPTTLSQALWVDIGQYWAQWAVMLVLGTIYFLVQSFLPVDGCPTGYLGAGGLADQGLYFGLNCTGGAHRAVDVSLFGIHHIYHDENGAGVVTSSATCDDTYLCDVHDPEGALGWISAAWMTFLGLQAGRVITTYRHLAAGPQGVKATVRPYLTRWLVWGVILSIIGGALCGFSKNEGLIPINKNLWSPSFVLVLAGWGFLKLSFHYMLVDVHKVWTGAPFRYVGMNSLVVYMTHELLSDYAPLQTHMQGDLSSHAEALASNLGGVITMVCFARFLYLRGIFVNV